jgi:hypothetical protein
MAYIQEWREYIECMEDFLKPKGKKYIFIPE